MNVLFRNIDIEAMENEMLRQQAIEEAGDGVPSVLGRYASNAEVKIQLLSSLLLLLLFLLLLLSLLLLLLLLLLSLLSSLLSSYQFYFMYM